jgi:acyl-CoA synthetase (NDP forming)
VLSKLIDPQSVAVVGASTKPGSVGYVILEDQGIPVYPTPDRAAKALWALYKYGEVKRRL